MLIPRRNDLIRVRLELETLSKSSSREADHADKFRDDLFTSLANHHHSLTQSLEKSTQKVDQVDTRIDRIEKLLMAQATMFDQSQLRGFASKEEDTAVAIRRRPTGGLSVSDSEKPMATAQAVGIRVRKAVDPMCRSGCSCICHTERSSTSARYLDRVIGRLFVGYSGLPLLNTSCDSARCQRTQNSTISAEYWFPMGFCWSQIIRFEFGYIPNIGPQWELTTLRRVPDSAQCVKFALAGDIDGLKSLFQLGMASPRDVSSTRGYSLLRVSTTPRLRPFEIIYSLFVSGLCMDNNMRLVGFYWLLVRILITSRS